MSWLVAFKQIDIVARLEMTTLIIIIGILLIAFAVYSTIHKCETEGSFYRPRPFSFAYIVLFVLANSICCFVF